MVAYRPISHPLTWSTQRSTAWCLHSLLPEWLVGGRHEVARRPVVRGPEAERLVEGGPPGQQHYTQPCIGPTAALAAASLRVWARKWVVETGRVGGSGDDNGLEVEGIGEVHGAGLGE